jgi:periplasmic protein TonB
MSQRNVKSAPNSEILSDGNSRGTAGINHWLIHQAACRAPESLSQRLEEEWLADLAARPSAMSRLRFAIGCCWATQVIAFEYQPSRIPVTSSVVEGKLVSAYAQHGLGNFSSRSTTLFLVVTLHAALFYGVLTTLSHIHGSVVPAPLQNRLVENPHPLPLPPSLPAPQLNRPTIQVPTPDFDVAREPDPSQIVAREIIPEPSLPLSPLSPPHAVKQVQGGPGTGFPNPDDFYPTLARHMEEQGIATVRVCVDVNGRLTSDPTTLQGTGSPRLDEGALKLARAGSGHYRATTEDGRPVNSCYPFRIRFQLRN